MTTFTTEDRTDAEKEPIPFFGWVDKEDSVVNHPKHYCNHPSGVECIQITEHLNFCLGNAVKYIWRAGEKYQEKDIEDLEKSAWYLAREIDRRKKAKIGY